MRVKELIRKLKKYDQNTPIESNLIKEVTHEQTVPIDGARYRKSHLRNIQNEWANAGIIA
jgi:hypothetical protein